MSPFAFAHSWNSGKCWWWKITQPFWWKYGLMAGGSSFRRDFTKSMKSRATCGTLGPKSGQRPFVRDGRLRALPFFLRKWTDHRDLPPVAKRSFTERWAELERER